MRPTKPADFEVIAKHHNINMLYEPKKDSGKDAKNTWGIVYGKIQYKNGLAPIIMGLLRLLSLHEKDVLCKNWKCRS